LIIFQLSAANAAVCNIAMALARDAIANHRFTGRTMRAQLYRKPRQSQEVPASQPLYANFDRLPKPSFLVR
jgi:hypothetical protein